MTQIIKNLDEITTEYSVFEKDQVLTAGQLNSIANYFEDQTRLTRTQLLGVGVVCGLIISVQGKQIKVSKGMGVTTDGDLLYFSSDMTFGFFKVYDEKNPTYLPFYKENEIIPLYELIPVGINDNRAFSLSQFSEKTDLKLTEMSALLYMENYIHDPDICDSTDCNNVGQKMINKIRVLLVSRDYLGILKPVVPSPHQAYHELEEIVADRPTINSLVKTHAQLVLQYRNVCTVINKKLTSQLPKIFPACSFFLTNGIATDPSGNWLSVMEKWNSFYNQNETGIQYYYDFLRDVNETYNEFHELLFDDATWCSPDKDAFPKHLILGTIGKDPSIDEDRTELYPSQLTSHTQEQKKHAAFLANKINTLIVTFESPTITAGTEIRITPGKSEEYSLEKRAIPYFYKIGRNLPPIHESWNFRLHQRRKDTYNYSYNAEAYGAQGAAANPMSAQIGKFDFFRIEGHLGQGILRAHNFLENEISTKNLPINLRSVMLGEDKRKIVIKPGFVFTELHKLHNLMRQDVLNQLDEVKRFSTGLKSQVNSSLDLLDPKDRGTFVQVAEGRNNELTSSIDLASDKLKGSYQEYATVNTEADSWKKHVSLAMEQSGTFKGQLSIAAKTEFNTPFDSLISNRHIDMLDHLDELIRIDTDKKQNKLLFNNYIAEHPGLEHSAGVMRGGTFVLVYDENSTVIADFMLPYQETDAEKNDLLEPQITIKPLRPGFVIDKGLNLFSPIDRKIKGQLDDFKVNDLDGILNVKTEGIRTKLDGDWNARFNDQQKDYFTSIKESFGTMSNALIKRIGTNAAIEGADINIKDSTLHKTVTEVKATREVLDNYKAKAEKAADPVEKKRYTDLAGMIEEDLSTSINEATQLIANTDMDVSLGTDGFNAMMEISKGVNAINNTEILNKTTDNLNKLTGTARNTSFNILVGSIVRR